jgi:hypothetical protein
MVARKNPDLQERLQKINEGWANYKRVERAAASTGAEDGNFTAAQLQAAVKAMDRSKDKGSFARGDALMQDLSEAAKSVQASKVPDSGTPLRHAVMATGAGIAGHSLIPGAEAFMLPVAGGLAAASVPYTNPVQSLISASRPQWLRSLANRLVEIAPAGGAMLPALTR